MLVVKYGSMKNSPIKKAAAGPRSSAEVAAEMSTLGAMLPGSIRKTFRTYSTKKRGEVRVEAQPIYTTWDPVKKRQVSRHVPKERFEEIRAMTLNYARYRELQREFDEALVRENMPAAGRASKKNGVAEVRPRGKADGAVRRRRVPARRA